MLKTILIVLAAIAFGLGALRISGPLNWTDAGFCLLTIALFLI